MKRLLAFCILSLSISLFARDIGAFALQGFSQHFKDKLKENSYSGLFCYLSPNERRVFACDKPDKIINLGDSSNIITNYLAFQLEKKGKFDRSADVSTYAKIFKYDAKKISFADLISSTALIRADLDKLYPKDASEEEYFDFLLQMNPNLLSGANYEYSKFSNLGAVYALSYSQSKSQKGLMANFEKIVEENKGDLSSLTLLKSENNLELNFTLSLKDFTTYLAKELETFSAKGDVKRGQVSNAWLFTEIGLCRLAMVAGQNENTYLIANFYDANVAIAIFIDANDEKARNFVAFILQDFANLLGN